MPDVTRLHPGATEFEFEVTGRVIIAAHCVEDAEMELQSICDDVFLDSVTRRIP
jgi:hypothetical protein